MCSRIIMLGIFMLYKHNNQQINLDDEQVFSWRSQAYNIHRA